MRKRYPQIAPLKLLYSGKLYNEFALNTPLDFRFKLKLIQSRQRNEETVDCLFGTIKVNYSSIKTSLDTKALYYYLIAMSRILKYIF